MKINSSVLVFSGKITKIGDIITTKSGRKVVSVTIPARIGIDDTIEMKSIEVSFWNEDAAVVSQLPLGTPVTVTGVPYFKRKIEKPDEKKPETWQFKIFIVVSATLWNTTAPIPDPEMPKVLKEQMVGGKYKGETYIEIITKDREYINALIVNEKTPENWKVKLVEVTKAFDDYKAKGGKP